MQTYGQIIMYHHCIWYRRWRPNFGGCCCCWWWLSSSQSPSLIPSLPQVLQSQSPSLLAILAPQSGALRRLAFRGLSIHPIPTHLLVPKASEASLGTFYFLLIISEWSSSHLVIWSYDHLIIWSPGHLVNMVIWRSGHMVNMVIWSACHLVILSIWSSSHLVNMVICSSGHLVKMVIWSIW